MAFKFQNFAIRIMIDKTPLGTLPHIKNFEDKLDKFNALLDSLPQKVEMKQMSRKEWDKLSITNYKIADIQLHGEINSFIEFAYIISSFKVTKLMNYSIESFERDNFYIGLILSRQLMEVCCLCYNSVTKLKPVVEAMNDATNDRMRYNLLDLKREAITNVIHGGTGHDAILTGRADSVKVRSILSEIDEVSKIEKYSTLRKKYDILSEFVHPDCSSNELFGMVNVDKIDLNKLNWNERFTDQKLSFIQNVEIDEFYKDLPKNYLIAHYPRYFGFIVSILDMCIDLMTESIEIGKNLYVALVTDPSPIGELFYRADSNKKNEVIHVLDNASSVKNEEIIKEICEILMPPRPS